MKKKTIILVTAAVLLLGIVILVHNHFMDRGRLTTEPDFSGLARTVSGNDLVSEADPPVMLRFAPTYRYLGGQKFILYGVADTEQHFFVETAPDGALRSLYWVQFEAYLPGKPHKYDYDDSPLRLQLGDYVFFTDTAPVEVDPNRKRSKGTDGAMMRQFIGSKGYALPDNFFYARMVYLTDETRKKELMIIFVDDLAPLGMTGSQLEEGGAHAQRWPEIEQMHLDKVRRTLQVLGSDQ